ncbi:MAG: outer membrane beta-barrel protein [Deltaproteobacteria bacterium]|nr:outer membrane beta-barrel protein [Deltaproteobacteria bacterium]
MRSICTTIVITAAGLLLFSQFAQASDVEAELRQMQERIADLENQLGNETDSSQLAEEESGSALSSMLENTDIGGWIAPSYNYNFEGHHNGATAAANTASSHPSTNTFQLDQAWISIDNAATEDSRGGAHLDYEWGVVNGAGKGGSLYSAYISYLAPIHEGINLDVGLIPTMVGAEVNQTNANFNVTRGLVWGIQPVTNVGAVVSGEISDGFSAALGVLNDPYSTAAIDSDNEKAVTAQLAYAADNWSAGGTVVWGDIGDTGTGIYDFLLSSDVSDDVSAWLNYTIVDIEDVATVHGIAAAARMALSEEMGVALRGEALFVDVDGGGNFEVWSITTTGDYALTEHLTTKLELRIDINDDTLPDSRGVPDEDVAAMILAQFIYEF